MAANSDPIQIDMHHAAILKLVDSLMIIRTLVHLGTSASTASAIPPYLVGGEGFEPPCPFSQNHTQLENCYPTYPTR